MLTHWPSRRPNAATPSSAPAIAAAACGDATSSDATRTSSSSSDCATSTRSAPIAAREFIGVNCPTFTNFDEMIEKTKPDLLMVTTVDGFHHEYIIKGLDRGIDVMTEKPLTTDETKCQAILDAEKRNNRKIVVTFNYRYAPAHQQMKEILLSNEIGKVVSVDFSWYLDVVHGADYFRRWHRLRKNSGSLLVHKASHHFDLMNWWLGADPVEVSGYGGLQVYGKNGTFRRAARRQLPQLLAQVRVPLLLRHDEGQAADGSLRRRARTSTATTATAASSARTSTSSTTCQAIVKYSNGATMNYALNAYMPYEGYRVAFNGEKGRLDVQSFERQPWEVADSHEIYVTKSFGKRTKVPMPKMTEGHGGGDDRHARSDLQEDRRAGVHEAARFARRRDVVPHRHRDPEQHRPEAADQDRRSRQGLNSRIRSASGFSRTRSELRLERIAPRCQAGSSGPRREC